jgi:hypothetical protein
MIIKRTRVKHEKTFQERSAEEALRFNALAKQRRRQTTRIVFAASATTEMASHINDWLSSPGLQPPKELRNLRQQEVNVTIRDALVNDPDTMDFFLAMSGISLVLLALALSA